MVDRPAAAKSTQPDAVEEWIAFLRDGLPVGGPPYPTRDELYDQGS
jgi:hypothetical protein